MGWEGIEEEIRVYYLIQRVGWFAGRTANRLLGLWAVTKKGEHIGRREALHTPGAAIRKEPQQCYTRSFGSNLTPGLHSGEICAVCTVCMDACHHNICIREPWRQPKCPSRGEHVKRGAYGCRMLWSRQKQRSGCKKLQKDLTDIASAKKGSDQTESTLQYHLRKPHSPFSRDTRV